MINMKRQNIRTLSLVVITLTYLIIGAAVFDHFESTNERMENMRLTHNISLFKKKHNMNDTEFNRLWHKILEKKPYRAGNQWKFVGSLYFCTVVVTLIGYGHSTPRTVSGKCFCIFYTLIGIPIFLIMFQSVGERLNSLIVYILAKIKKRMRLKNQEVGLVELITIEGCFTMTITILASYIFMRNEDWSFFDSMYYCFITLTTIGFGDMVPMQQNNSLSNNFAYACFTILFILIGLTTLASSMNLLVLRLATINAEEQVQERLEAAEARRQAVHLEGDVISPNSRLFNTQEQPDQVETISVCSCACLDYKIWHDRHLSGRQRRRHSSKLHNEVEHINNFSAADAAAAVSVAAAIATSTDGAAVVDGADKKNYSLLRPSASVKRLYSKYKGRKSILAASAATKANTAGQQQQREHLQLQLCKENVFELMPMTKAATVESNKSDETNDNDQLATSRLATIPHHKPFAVQKSTTTNQILIVQVANCAAATSTATATTTSTTTNDKTGSQLMHRFANIRNSV